VNNRYLNNQEERMSRRHKRGQSTLEYVLLVTAVIVVLIALVLNKQSPFQNALNSTLTTGINGMTVFSNRLNR
jgi:uncharacterized protein (UPF0333 family)